MNSVGRLGHLTCLLSSQEFINNMENLLICQQENRHRRYLVVFNDLSWPTKTVTINNIIPLKLTLAAREWGVLLEIKPSTNKLQPLNTKPAYLFYTHIMGYSREAFYKSPTTHSAFSGLEAFIVKKKMSARIMMRIIQNKGHEIPVPNRVSIKSLWCSPHVHQRET